MKVENGLITFTDQLRQEIIAAAEIDGEETLHPHAFTQYMIDELAAAGELEDGMVSYHRAHGLEVSGYNIGDDGAYLDLFVTLYRDTTPPASIGKQEIESALKRLSAFLARCLAGYHTSLEESSPAFDMALSIFQERKNFERLRFFLFTDGLATVEFKPEEKLNGIPVSYHIWDIQRLYRFVKAGRHQEAIEIDFEKEFGHAVPCLSASEPSLDYNAYLSILPGTVLDSIYSRYGPRLLELNVRSFLQARGKVNQGIRKTIVEHPDRFLAYNNGISATAHEIEIVDLPQGGQGIRVIRGLQIVNGGQTTASIHQAAKKDKADVSKVFVQLKLTVVARDKLNEIVPLISRYANSQNKVSEADFSANDPFHVRMEELSRTVWAPATEGTKRQTKWFYERARGQYQDALARESTPARMRQFKLMHPSTQRFSKTDLAKFENTWNQLPHLVSLGAQKNFQEFTLRLSERGSFEPDQIFFQRHVAKAILFRHTEKAISAQKYGGYRANIVTYTIAYLAYRTGSRIDFDSIWARQTISPVLEDAITTVSRHVHEVIINPPGGGNVTEWCKKKDCWEKVRVLEIDLPADLEKELLTGPGAVGYNGDRGNSEKEPEEQALIDLAREIPAEVWFEVSGWAKETGNLQSWQRSLAYSLGRLAGQGREPSYKQAKQGLLLLKEAERLGYTIEPPITLRSLPDAARVRTTAPREHPAEQHALW